MTNCKHFARVIIGWLLYIPMLAIVLSPIAVAPVQAAPVQAAPNVVIILVDDAGLMDFAPFGGEAHMPNIQALADRGVRFSHYRTSPLCAPSRAMLLTGIDNHLTGIATIPEVIPSEHAGKPGYSMALEPGVKTVAEYLRTAGYRTYMTGKWHMGSRLEDLPISHGFDRSFVLDASGADNWEQKPYMVYYETAPWYEDDQPATLPEDFYSSAFIVDKMIEYIDSAGESNTDAQPFFAYLAFQAIHIPIQAPREFTDRYTGVYDQGWQVLREQRWEKAQLLGLIPQNAPLAAMPEGLRVWEDLDAQERQYYSKAMSVNAGMLEAMDHHIGRLIHWLEAEQQLANTLFVITSDNGPEFNDVLEIPGSKLYRAINGYHNDIERMGERGSLVSIGPEWASAAASPNSKFKFYSSDGGIRVPLIITGPNIPNNTMQSSLAMVTDITPTLLDYLDLAITVDKQTVAITGRSLLPVINGESDHTYGPSDAVGLEVAGNAALFKGNYKISRNLPPYGDSRWQLYDIETDPGETNDLSASRPALLSELRDDYQRYALAYNVQAMPEDYSMFEQVVANTLKRRLASYQNYLFGFLLLGMGLIIWMKSSKKTR